jgi:hypothetical protein
MESKFIYSVQRGLKLASFAFGLIEDRRLAPCWSKVESLQVIHVGFLIVVGFVALTAVVSQAMTDKQ